MRNHYLYDNITLMPITKSAKKAIRVAARKRVFNLRRMRAMKEAIKAVKDEATLSASYKAIDKAAKRGVIKPNTAARRKSRLVRALRHKTVA